VPQTQKEHQLTYAELPELVKIYADPAFDHVAGPPGGTSASDLPALAYSRLQHVHENLGITEPLLAGDHDYLRSLLELAAMADPCLFQVMFLHHCMALGAALDYGACDDDIAELATGASIGAALMTELGQGNSSASIRTEAAYDPVSGGFLLNTPVPGAAKYPPNVALDGLSRLAVVSARLTTNGTDCGTFLFLVRLRDEAGLCPGVSITPRPPTALQPLDYATVCFRQVPVPYARWLRDGASISAGGDFHDPLPDPQARTRRSVSISRFALGAIPAGLGAAARASVAIAVHHAQRRRTVNRFVSESMAIDYRHQQRLLLTALAAAIAVTALGRRAPQTCWRIAAPGQNRNPPAAALREATLAKVAADVLAERAISRCRAASGALGFFSENRLVDYEGLALAFVTAGGNNQLILLDAAWSVVTGDDYTPPPGSDRPLPGEEPESGGPQASWLWLLGVRERRLLEELTSGLRAAGSGSDQFSAWDSQSHLAQEFAEAYAARLMLQALLAEADSAGDADRASLLTELCWVVFLEEVSAHDGWYLAAGLLSAADVRSLPGRVDLACQWLAARLPALTDMLDVPMEIIRSTLVSTDYIAELARS
jgi:acyl-CoA oxidase